MDLTALKQALAELLQSASGLAEAEVLPAFPAKKHLPLQSLAILLGIDGLELTPGGLGGFCHGQDGSPASITIRFDLFAPGSGGRDLAILYEALCAALVQSSAQFGLSRIWRDPLAWDDAAGSYRLTARAILQGRARAGIGREAQPTISDFRLSHRDAPN